MFVWSLSLMIIVILDGTLAFFGVAGAPATIAEIVFVVFLILLAVNQINRAVRGESTRLA